MASWPHDSVDITSPPLPPQPSPMHLPTGSSASSSSGSGGSSDGDCVVTSLRPQSPRFSQVKRFWDSGAGDAAPPREAAKEGSSVSSGSPISRTASSSPVGSPNPQDAPPSISTVSESESRSSSSRAASSSSAVEFGKMQKSSSTVSRESAPEDDCVSCYSHASAIDLSAIVLPVAALNVLPDVDKMLEAAIAPVESDVSLPSEEKKSPVVEAVDSRVRNTPSGMQSRKVSISAPFKRRNVPSDAQTGTACDTSTDFVPTPWQPTPIRSVVVPLPSPPLPELPQKDEYDGNYGILWDTTGRAGFDGSGEKQALDVDKQHLRDICKEECDEQQVPEALIGSAAASSAAGTVRSDSDVADAIDTATDTASERFDNSGDLGVHDVGRRCSFAESFARRDLLGARRKKGSDQRQSDRIKDLKRQFTASELVDRAAAALAELLDQNRRAASRLTEGTRAFAVVFSINEKHVFGSVVRRALQIIRGEYIKQQRRMSIQDGRFHGRKLVSGHVETASVTEDGEKMGRLSVAVRPSEDGPSSMQSRRGTRRSVTDVDLARRILFGTPSSGKAKYGVTSSSRRTPKPVMLITDGREKASKALPHIGATKRTTAISIPSGPLTASISNESVEVQLPFGATLLAVLAIMARLDCELIFKKRKNKAADAIDRRGKSTALVHARARHEHNHRYFLFSVLVSGSSPTRVTFRRPRFISLRRVDDYVDVVVDSKELLTEYCNNLWGRDI